LVIYVCIFHICSEHLRALLARSKPRKSNPLDLPSWRRIKTNKLLYKPSTDCKRSPDASLLTSKDGAHKRANKKMELHCTPDSGLEVERLQFLLQHMTDSDLDQQLGYCSTIQPHGRPHRRNQECMNGWQLESCSTNWAQCFQHLHNQACCLD